VLVGFGVYLLSQRGQASDEQSASEGGPVDEQTAEAAYAAGFGSIGRPSAPGSARLDRMGLVTPTVISVLAIGAGVAAALHAAGLVPLSVTGMAAGGLVVVGAGLIASLWLGRARGLVPLGLGFAALMVAAPSIGPWIDRIRHTPPRVAAEINGRPMKAMGNHTFAPQTLAELEPSYEVGLGKLELDLTHLDFTGEIPDLEVNVGIGDATILLPPGVAVEVRGDVGIGRAEALGQSNEGIGTSIGIHDDGAGAGHLDIELNVGLGSGQVRRGL
jgi:hypothetical protein